MVLVQILNFSFTQWYSESWISKLKSDSGLRALSDKAIEGHKVYLTLSQTN